MRGNNIRQCRESLGLSQVELARRAKMSASNLSALERGRLLPWDKAKRVLARALKTTPAALFPEEN
jgi:transcriptional regulator with XRE-family HTH domain